MKQLKLTFLLIMLMSMVGTKALAYDAQIDGICYNLNGTDATVTSFGFWALDENLYTGSVVIPGSVTFNGITYTVSSIGEHAFFSCPDLTSVSIPNSVLSIGAYAFEECRGLTSLTIGNGVASIGVDAFKECKSLTEVHISDISAWCKISFTYDNSNPLVFAHHLYMNNEEVTDLVIPDDVTNIGSYAFIGCANLTSVTIGNGVTTIGERAFHGCSGLSSITIGKNVDNIHSGSFVECTGLKTLTINSSICRNEWFAQDPTIISVTLGDNVKTIDDGAFHNCTELTSVTIGNGVTSTGDMVFWECSKLANVVIGNSVTNIGSCAFDGCSSLVSVDIPESVTSIGSCAFQNCVALSSVTIPNSVTTIGDHAFSGCTGLTSAFIGNGLTSVGENAFDNWSSIRTLTINSPSSCDYWFSGNTSLSSVVIGDNVTSIADGAFSGCTGLTSITIGNSVKSIGEMAFYDCQNLTSLIIPNSVESIGKYTFMDCKGLTSLTIPNSVTTIDEYAFWNCTGLTNINIPEKVTNISLGTFEGCNGLTSMVIPSGLKSIGAHAFADCSGLNTINIPRGVESIGESAFSGCNNLTSVSVEWAEPITITSDVFTNRANATLYVPSGSKTAYKNAEYWQDFKEIMVSGVQEYTLDIIGSFDSNESHLYDRDGNEYDYIGSGNNEFDEGSYIRIEPFVAAALYIREIIVNGESVGTWTEENAPTEYVIESLSENTTVEFKTYLRAQWRTLGCIAEGPGKVEMYKNGNLIGTTSSPENYFSDVFECGDVIKLVLVPDAGSTLTQFLGGEYGSEEALRENLLGEITDNSYSFTFNPDDIVNKYGYLVRFFKATFEGPEPSITNTLSASVPTLLLGKQATLSLSLTNEDELIACEFDLQLPNGITIAKDEDDDPIATLSSRASKHSLAVSDKGNGLYHFLCYSNSNKAFSGNEGELLSIELLCDGNMALGTYQATVKNIIFSDVDKNKITPNDYTFDLEVIEAVPGDVNKDGEINVMDVVEMVAYIMGQGSEGFVFAAADLYLDGDINVMDLVNLVDLIMHPTASSNARGWTENGMSLSTMADGAVAVKVNNPEQYVASEFIVEVSAGQTLETVTADKHHRVTCSQLDDSHYKVMTFSSANSTFNSDALVQLHISGEGMVNVHDALLVDENRKGVAFAPAAGGYTTGINQMENGKLIIENSSVYDLQGKKRDTSRPYKHEVLIVNGKKQVVR